MYLWLQTALTLRDEEIQRVSQRLEAGPHLDHLSLISRAEAHEAIILQLHSQLEEATAKLVQTDAAEKNTQSVEVELRDSKQAVLVRMITSTRI